MVVGGKIGDYGAAGKRMRRAAFAALMMTSSLATVGMAAPAYAQEATRDFDIPAQPLANALTAFGQQSGLQVSAQAPLVEGRTSSAVKGALSPMQALSQLLTGTGLSFRVVGSTVTLEPAPQSADGAIQLGPVRVEGEGGSTAGYPVPSTSTIGNLPPAYAGGQVARGGQLGMLGNKDVMDTPFSQTNYTNKTIQDQQAQSLQDILANDPSVVLNTHSTGNEFGAVVFRGFYSGVESLSGSLNGLASMVPSRAPDMDYIERVEVLKGPSALLNGMAATGSGGSGGMYNLVTKQAGDEPLTQLTTRYSSRSQFGVHLDVGRRFGENNQFGVRFNGAYRDGDTPVKPTSAEAGLAALNLDYRGERVRISADFAHQSNNASPRNAQILNIRFLRVVPKAPDAGTSLNPSWSHDQEKSTAAMVRGEVDITDNVTAYAAIGKQKWDFSFFGPNSWALLDTSGTIDANYGVVFRNNFSSEVLSMQGGLRATATTGPVGHALSLNLSQAQRETRENDYVSAPYSNITNLYNPTFNPAPSIDDPGPLKKSSETRVSSIGVADTLSILGERIQFTAGIRYQKVKTDNFDTATGDKTSGYDSFAWTPAFGLVVKPRENISLYANYIENLQAGSTVSSDYANSGEVFPPYVSKQYEAGIKIDWGTVTTTLAAFQIAQPDTIEIPDSSGGLPTLAVSGEQRNRGIELNAYGELVPGFRVMGGLTLLDAKLTKTQDGLYDGNRPYGAPQVRAVVSGEWDTPFLQNLTLTGRVSYTGNQVASVTSENPKIPSYSIVDLGARYVLESPWNKRITVRFNVDNVLGKNYWAYAYGNPLFLGEPRTYRLSATFDF